ncbi:glycosyltransferase family protein [Paenibacillus oceani]|uniref:Nucleotide-diphospho-sugar transferase domain-containing protein n=1 Tax=Paenibacillus oceani TaxID=2772510 RepID=A0A927C6Z3_9BACL|nr:hypothetical protein [Paenibacillus oceani]MBD2860886.1 hypothetical protein [Paenibacillus oceani]
MEDLRIPSLPFSWRPQNKMLICSIATGAKHIALLRVMAPTVAFYALQHKMDSLVLPLESRLAPSRPPAWDKIVLIYNALRMYETVMWIDADAIICDPGKDIREALDPDRTIHLVAHKRSRGRLIPNTGVWVCRRADSTLELLEKVWEHAAYIHHRWWEQAALMDLIGYDPQTYTFQGPTPYSGLVQFLDHEWNSRNKDSAPHPIIYHYCNKHKPVEDMEEHYSRFLNRIAGIEPPVAKPLEAGSDPSCSLTLS